MTQSCANRNLLIGILALQMDFVAREALIAATSVWIKNKARPLDEILLEHKALSNQQHALLSLLVDEHIRAHGDDIERSLAAAGSIQPAIREELGGLGDADIDMSLVHLPLAENGAHANETMRLGVDPETSVDPHATRSMLHDSPASDSQRYQVLRPHATGGLGKVSVAMDRQLNREVALKEIQTQYADRHDSQARFLLEAEITGGLEHPGIVPVYGLGRYSDGRPYYAMRFIRGDSLKDAIDRMHDSSQSATNQSNLELRKLLARFIDVCNAVEYAHSRGVLHRDLKPSNIMLGKYGETLVVDWGLAKAVNRDERSIRSSEPTLRPSSGSGSTPTQMGSAIGTPAYMSPEQAEGRLHEIDTTSDVYSLGATLYCMLTGQPPITDKDAGAALRKVQAGDFPHPRRIKPSTPKPLEAVCLKAMSLNPGARYKTPRTLADDVEKWLADEPVSAKKEPVHLRVARWARRNRGVVVTTAISLTLLTAMLAASTFLLASKNTQLQLATKRAERSFRQAQLTVDEFFTQVSEEQLLNEPGMQPLRQRLLERALEHYETLVGEQAENPSTKKDLAKSYFRVADIQWDIGANADALKAFEESRSLTEQLLNQQPQDRELRLLQAAIYDATGSLRSRVGQTDLAKQELTECLRIRSELAEEFPEDAEVQRKTARSLRALGSLEARIGVAGAMSRFRDARDLLEPLAKKHLVKKYSSIHADLAETYTKIAAHTVQDPEALEQYDRAIAIQRNLIEAFPRVLSYQESLGDLLFSIGMRHRDAKPGVALKTLEESTTLRRRLATLNPDVKEFQADLGWVLDQVGFIYHQRGDLDKARDLFGRARDIHNELIRIEPTEVVYKQRLAMIYNGLGLVERDQGNFDASISAFQEALSVQQELIDKNDGIIDFSLDLSGTHNNMARMHIRFERWDEALDSQQAALEIRQQLVQDYPDQMKPQRWSAESLMSIGLLQSMRGEKDKSLEAYLAANKIFRKLVDQAPKNAVYTNRLLDSRIGLAMSLVDNGEYEKAAQQTEEIVSEGGEGLVDYNAACVYSRLVAAIKEDHNVAESERSKRAVDYSDRAMTLLNRSADKGGFQSPQMKETLKTDPDLDALRSREDFRELMAKIEDVASEPLETTPGNSKED